MLLRRLKAGGHKALIFTQMTRMLDVLEAFLNLHGHTYLRLDGSTKPEMRQARYPHTCPETGGSTLQAAQGVWRRMSALSCPEMEDVSHGFPP